MSNLTLLRSYALKTNPASLPPSVLFSHTENTLTIYDAYPKSIFHFLILPRTNAFLPLSVFDLTNLRTLLKGNKERAKEVISTLNDEATKLKKEIEEEMVNRYGFKWDIWMGFHPVPSMEHLHLHVLSADLRSPSMKTKKHYNSFRPKLGFFQHIDDVLSWFDAEPSYFNKMSELKKSKYEPLLKENLTCFRCDAMFKNIPTLKSHLEEEWNKLVQKEKAKHAKQSKRRRETEDAKSTTSHGDSSSGTPPKRQKLESPPDDVTS
ncbi:unnamed protein product [Somion occarium]|uniref:Aprataxin C2HE/C2H2/C2HC zinc finger domain-containing protein n=1 Tax=Somion occarium TaxID=3059160 RepID=A0ABP1D9J5_9APHY